MATAGNTMRTAAALLVLAGLCASALAAAHDCDTGCKLEVKPVCGDDGQSYSNECLAACNSVKMSHDGYCTGNTLRFVASNAAASAKESAQVNLLLTAKHLARFTDEGFKLVGQVAMSSGHVAGQEAAKAPAAAKGPGAHVHKGDRIKAYRVTTSGHVYVKQFTYDPSNTQEIPPTIPSGHNSLKSQKPARSLLAANSIIGADQRQYCPSSQQFPYSAIGEIDFRIGSAQYICSGALIRSNRVLTAAHCVWDQESGSFTSGIDFAPGRYVDGNGATKDPFGSFPWSHATMFTAFRTSGEQRLDIALIDLDRAAPASLGLMGVKAACTNAAVPVTVAGYPADRPFGTCMKSTCSLKYDCTADAGSHTCDTTFGMSGSSVWDNDGYIRAVHVRGMSIYNEATVISQAVLDQINQWSS